MSWMQTYTGKHFNPLDPDPDLIDIEDIAHALSNLCRFNGHTRVFYSVAEHCVWTAAHCPEGLQLTGLLHDAAEAYLGDMIRPLKPAFPNFALFEDALLKAIMVKFGGIFPIPDEVKCIDDRMVVTEGVQLVGDVSEWGISAAPLDMALLAAPPKLAEQMFLDTFSKLSAGSSLITSAKSA